MKRKKKILFILKYRYGYFHCSTAFSSGLRNSVEMLVNMLNGFHGVEAKCVEVIDNNFINKEVSEFHPDIVIIEAIWVVPEKFDILKKLHPHVKWVIRNHSKSEFLAGEGTAFEWVAQYLQKGICVGCNSVEAVDDFRSIARYVSADVDQVHYLPNYYPVRFHHNFHWKSDKDGVDIGAFGAIRPLKNQMNQALAVTKFADTVKIPVNYHINATRLEGKGEPILKNIRSLFSYAPYCTLVEYPWLEHDDFLKLVSKMDMTLQVSLSETFNIVSADSVAMGVPVIASKYIEWLQENTEIDADSIKEAIFDVYKSWGVANFLRVMKQQALLKDYSHRSEKVWKNFIGG